MSFKYLWSDEMEVSSAKVRLSGDLSTAVATQPGGTAASFPFGCRPPGECCDEPDQSSVALVHGFSGQVIPTSVGGGKMGGSSNSCEPWLPRDLVSVLCVCLLTAHACCCGFQKFLVLNT